MTTAITLDTKKEQKHRKNNANTLYNAIHVLKLNILITNTNHVSSLIIYTPLLHYYPLCVQLLLFLLVFLVLLLSSSVERFAVIFIVSIIIIFRKDVFTSRLIYQSKTIVRLTLLGMLLIWVSVQHCGGPVPIDQLLHAPLDHTFWYGFTTFFKIGIKIQLIL